MKRRIPRDRRRAGVRVVLGPRDEALMRALARFRVATTADLTGLFFRGVRRDTAATRLRRLHDAGFIQASFGGLSEQNTYRLGPEGRYWAEEHGIAAGAPPAEPATHHLAIVQLWASVAAALAGDGMLRLKRFEPDWELRARMAGLGAPVVPDAAIEIAAREPESRVVARIALEVDLTTERSGVLRRKLAAYEVSSCFAAGEPVSLVVVLIGAGKERTSSIRSLLQTYWSGKAHVLPATSWPNALLEQLRKAPLTDTPCGKGVIDRLTAYGRPLSDTQPEPGEPLRSPEEGVSNGSRPRQDIPEERQQEVVHRVLVARPPAP